MLSRGQWGIAKKIAVLNTCHRSILLIKHNLTNVYIKLCIELFYRLKLKTIPGIKTSPLQWGFIQAHIDRIVLKTKAWSWVNLDDWTESGEGGLRPSVPRVKGDGGRLGWGWCCILRVLTARGTDKIYLLSSSLPFSLSESAQSLLNHILLYKHTTTGPLLLLLMHSKVISLNI